jgi:hypothetical protein
MANQVLYGFVNLQNMLDQRITNTNVGTVVTAIQRTLEEHQRQLAAFTSLFVEPTTLHAERYYPGSNARLQPLDENGRARPIRPAGFVDVGYPLKAAGTAWGNNWRARAKLTVGEVQRVTAQQITADVRWMRDQILAGIYADTDWTSSDDQYGALTIKPLANGDSQVYSVITGADSASTDDHNVGQAGAISVTDPFPAMRADLIEHPENSDTVVALIPTAQRADVEALAAFNRMGDPNIQPGSGSDQLVGSLGTPVPGEVFGYHDAGVWLSEWKALPAGYVIGVTPGGDPALAMREEEEAELRGFRLADERPDYPFYESQWVRIAGFGARNRVGAYVVRIGNATYAPPTGYAQPMP